MQTTFKKITKLLLLIGVFCTAANFLHAEDCNRGTLDMQYCDRNMDQVADLPLDPNDWIDPSTIIFAYTPVEDPAVYANVWKPFVTHLEEATDRKVVFFPVESNAAQVEAMRSGRLHVAGFNTGSNPLAVSCAGFSPFANSSLE